LLFLGIRQQGLQSRDGLRVLALRLQQLGVGVANFGSVA
jgi:hypothetical protein